jgi:hypothetical protein
VRKKLCNVLTAYAGDGTQQKPPFSPSVSPPDSAFSAPSGQADLLFTGCASSVQPCSLPLSDALARSYVTETAVWALGVDGYFDRVITAADVPAASPVQLTTNDPTLQSGVPGLAALPNMNITVTTKLLGYAPATIDASGAWL